MNPENCLVKKTVYKERVFPARIFGYLALCEQVKQNIKEKQESCLNNLPFVSEMTRKFSPMGVIHARLSCLRYNH